MTKDEKQALQEYIDQQQTLAGLRLELMPYGNTQEMSDVEVFQLWWEVHNARDRTRLPD